MKNKLVKDALILLAITVVCGVGLGAMYSITKEPIAQVDYQKTQNAYKAVMPDAASFEELPGFSEEEATAYVQKDWPDDTINTVMQAVDADGNLAGYVITVTSSAGYGGDVTFSIGYKPDGTLTKYSITTINETPGLGAKATESKFMDQFNDKNVDQFEVTKTGSTSDAEIDAITGATITSRAVTYGVNAGMLYGDYLLEQNGGEVVE